MLMFVILDNFFGVCVDFIFKCFYSYFLSYMYGMSFVIVVLLWMGFVVFLE